MQKLPPRFNHVVVPMILTFFMTAIVAGVSTAIAVGLNAAALRIWPSAWVASWAIAFPSALVVLPFARWITRFVVREK